MKEYRLSKTEEIKKNPKGKILRVKKGYNPNSSSMGSVVFALPAALLGITAIFGAVSGIIMSIFIKKADKDIQKKEDISVAKGDSRSQPKENSL